MKQALLGVLLLVAAALIGLTLWSREQPLTQAQGDPSQAQRLQARARVIFITLDGPVRDDVLSGPHMRGFQAAVRSGGVAFAAEASSARALSLPGYQVMAAGALTGCRDNDCSRIEVETMAERVASALGLPQQQVAVFASWSRLALAATSRDGVVYVDAPQEGPLREGGPPWSNARFDEETFTLARAHWQAHHPRFLHLALLDTDEWAHQGRRAEYEQALRETDARVLEVLGWVAALPPEEAAVTTVLLAADHGRGRGKNWSEHGFFYPGSREIFVAAIGPLVKGGAPQRVDQRDVRPTVERLMGLCPPKVSGHGDAIEAIVGDLPCSATHLTAGPR